jgi:hypothetical protein
MADRAFFSRGTRHVSWGKNKREELAHWLRFEISRALAERQDLAKSWRGWIEDYRAPKPRVDDEGAANYTVPLNYLAVDLTKSKYVQSIHATPNIWTLKPLNERWVDYAKPMQDWLQWTDLHLLHMWDVNQRVVNEMLKLGTGVYKVWWKFEERPVTGYDQALKRTKLLRQVNQPVVDHVWLDNFLVPPESLGVDPDAQGGAPWVAERFRLRPDVVRQQAKSQEPFLPNYDPKATERVLNMQGQGTEGPGPTDYEQKVADLDQVSIEGRLTRRPIELWECHVRFDADNDGSEEDLVVIFHVPSAEILRATYNPYAHGRRPYHVTRFLRGDGFYGIGLGERSEMWQDLLSNLMNYEIDTTLLRNAPMLAYKEGANILPNEPIFPLKQWPLADPEKDLKLLHLAGGAPGDVRQLLGFAQDLAQQSVGVTDLQLGAVGQVPSRTPATTVQSLLAENATRIDMSLKDARQGGLSDVGLQVLQLMQQQVGNVVNNPDGQRFLELAVMVLGEPEGRFVAEKLQTPFEDVSLGLGVELTATSAVNNKELSKQNFLALMQLVGQRAPLIVQMAQIAQQAAGSPVGQVASDLLRAEQELMTRLLEQFDIRNPEDIVPNVDALIQAQTQAAGLQAAPGAFGGPGAGFEGAGGPSGPFGP